MRLLRILIAVPIVFLMIGFAKIAQSAAVDALGARLGFNLASFIGVAPVIATYVFLATRIPDPFRGAKHGRRTPRA